MRKMGCLIGVLLSAPAAAVDFQLGPLSGELNTRIAFGAAMRVEARDTRLLGKLSVPGQLDLCPDDCMSQSGDPEPNQRLVDARGSFSGTNEDNGNLNYDRGDLTAAVLQIRPQFGLFWEGWQLQASATAYHDFVNVDFDETHTDTRFQPERTPRSRDVERRFASGIRPGNLYLAKSFLLGERELSFRVGQQVLSWGEANLVQFNGLSEWSPLDATALAMPGSELNRLQQAVPLATVAFTLNEVVSAELVYQLRWRRALLPPTGSLLSFNDIAGGGRYAILGFGGFHEDPERQYAPTGLAATVSQASRTLYIEDEDFAAPSDDGQFGARLNYFADWLNNGTEIALHAMRYHSRFPVLSALAAQDSCTRDAAAPGFAGAFVACQGFNASFNPVGLEPLPVDTLRPFLDYPEGIGLYGLSFNTNVGDWAVSGELAYRPNAPLQILQSDVLFTALGPAFPAQDIPIGAGSLNDPALLQTLPDALSTPLSGLQNALLAQLPPGATLTLPGEDNAIPDFLSRYRGQTISGGDLVRGYERHKVSQLSLTGLRIFSSNPVGADQVLWVVEGAIVRVHDMPSRQRLFYEGAGDRTHPSPGADGSGSPDGEPDARRINPTQMTGGFGDALSWGYRSLLRLTYTGLPWNLTAYPAFVFMHDVDGISPAPILNFVQGRQVRLANLSFETQGGLAFGLTYQSFGGAGSRNRLRDRDNVSVFASYVF